MVLSVFELPPGTSGDLDLLLIFGLGPQSYSCHWVEVNILNIEATIGRREIS